MRRQLIGRRFPHHQNVEYYKPARPDTQKTRRRILDASVKMTLVHTVTEKTHRQSTDRLSTHTPILYTHCTPRLSAAEASTFLDPHRAADIHTRRRTRRRSIPSGPSRAAENTWRTYTLIPRVHPRLYTLIPRVHPRLEVLISRVRP